MSDFRLAIRSLLRAPVFAFVAILTLALGIGANAAVFSVVDGILLKALPFTQPDALMMVWEHNIPRGRRTNVVSPGNFIHWRERQQSFTDMAAFIRTTANISEGGNPEEVRMQVVSESFFRILGATPLRGRTFTPEEDAPPRDKMLISHGLWQRRFGGDESILGRKVTVSGMPIEIIGVMPAGFEFLDRDIDIWAPVALPATARTPRGRSISVVARLKPGVSIEQAQQEMVAIHGQLGKEFPDMNGSWSANVQPLTEHVGGDLRPTLLVLLGAVGFVVLVACANVAGLLLARAAARQREIAVRTALGASWMRLARQALAESLTLSALGGASGLLLAYLLVRLLLAAAESGLNLPRAHEIGLDMRVVGFTALVCLVTGLLFGLAPALWSRRAAITDSLKEGGRGGTGAHAARARGVLVIAEVALAIVLLTGGSDDSQLREAGVGRPGLRHDTRDDILGCPSAHSVRRGRSVAPLLRRTQRSHAGAAGRVGRRRGQLPSSHGPGIGDVVSRPGPGGARSRREARDRGARDQRRLLRGHGHPAQGRPSLQQRRTARDAPHHRHQRVDGAAVFPRRRSDRPPREYQLGR